MQGELNKETLTKTIENWLSTSNLPFRKMFIDKDYRYIINHNMGEKWSLYFDIVFCSLAAESGLEIKSKKIEDDTISLTLAASEE